MRFTKITAVYQWGGSALWLRGQAARSRIAPSLTNTAGCLVLEKAVPWTLLDRMAMYLKIAATQAKLTASALIAEAVELWLEGQSEKKDGQRP